MNKAMQMQFKNTDKFTPECINAILTVKENSGLTPENIVVEAQKKTSPLHNFFEWDNSSAASNWRLHQARLLINEVKVIIEEKEYYAFEHISLKINENSVEPSEYKTVVEIKNNEEYRQQVLRRALANILYWQQQYENYSNGELEPIFNAIAKVRTKLEKKWQKKKQ